MARSAALERVVTNTTRRRELVEGGAAHRQTRCQHEFLRLLGAVLAVMKNVSGRGGVRAALLDAVNKIAPLTDTTHGDDGDCDGAADDLEEIKIVAALVAIILDGIDQK